MVLERLKEHESRSNVIDVSLADSGSVCECDPCIALRRRESSDSGVLLRIADGATYFMYAPSGLGRRDTANNTPLSQVVICDERGNIRAAGGNSAARLFVTTPLGRATIVRDRALIENALTAMGATCP